MTATEANRLIAERVLGWERDTRVAEIWYFIGGDRHDPRNHLHIENPRINFYNSLDALHEYVLPKIAAKWKVYPGVQTEEGLEQLNPRSPSFHRSCRFWSQF